MFAEGRDSGRKKSEVLGEASQSDEHVEEGNQGADVSQLPVKQVRHMRDRRFRLGVRERQKSWNRTRVKKVG